MAVIKASQLTRDRVSAELKGNRAAVFEQLVLDYQDSAERLTGKRYARFEVLGDLVKAGWRKHNDVVVDYSDELVELIALTGTALIRLAGDLEKARNLNTLNKPRRRK